MDEAMMQKKDSRFESCHNGFKYSKRPHLLMITNHGIHQWDIIPGLPDTGGQNVFVNQMAFTMVKHGFKVTIVNRGGFYHPTTGQMRRGLDYQDENQRILYIEDSKKEFVRKEDMHEQVEELTDFLEVFLTQEDCPVDLIISHYWDGAKIGVLLNNRLPEKQKHIWVPHSLGALKKKNMDSSTWQSLRIDERIRAEKELIPELDDIGSTSAAVRNSLKEEYGYDTELFVPPCIDVDRFHPANLSRDSVVLGFLSQHSSLSPEEIKKRKIITEISRTDTTKRKDVLIKSFAKMHQKIPDSLLIVSIDENKSSLAKELQTLIEELHIRDSVIVVGSVWDVLPKIYAVTDLYCTPSVMEGFGMSIQEAAATAVPSIASNLVPFAVEHLLGSAVEEIPINGNEQAVLRKGEGTIIVPADDVDGFARAMEMMLSNEALRKQMARRAYDITIPYFTWENLINVFLRHIGIEVRPVELMLRHRFTRNRLERILRNENIADIDYTKIVELLKGESDIANHLPDDHYQIDPRNGEKILYNEKRAKRPQHLPGAHDFVYEAENPNRAPSVISKGKTTGVIDVADLSEGFTFINFNLMPALYPFDNGREAKHPNGPQVLSADTLPASGVHFLQWTSSYQDRDWHNMPLQDCQVVMRRLANLEKTILTKKGPQYVSVIKNCGRLVGSSIAHGHQQITASNVKPRRVQELEQFEQNIGRKYTNYMLEQNPDNLAVVDYGKAVLLVPYFMRRPYDMQLIVKDTEKSCLHQLNEEEIRDTARGIKQAIQAMRAILKGLSRQIAYNVVLHSGNGAGLFFEFLPYTQETGGFEHLGIYICQGIPETCAKDLRALIDG